MAKVKATFEISHEAKFRLATLKAELRRRGYAATEANIVEALINGASERNLTAALSRTT